MLRVAARQLSVRTAVPAVSRFSLPAVFIHTPSQGDYTAGFVSNPVRQETLGEKVSGASLVVEDATAPQKWWEEPEAKAKFAEWGVDSVVPPAEDSLRDSKSTGGIKFGPVTLHVRTAELKDKVYKQMSIYNRAQGSHQAFQVAVSPHSYAEGEIDAAFVSAPVRQETSGFQNIGGASLTVEDSLFPEKWWEDSEVKAQLAQWGVHSVTPSTALRDSKSTGLVKYGPVILHVKSEAMAENVTKQMTALNRSKGMHQAFEVAVSA